MKVDTHNDIAMTAPINSEASFRTELNKLQQEAENPPEVSNESEESQDFDQQEPAPEPDDQGDSADAPNHDASDNSLDDDFDPRTPVPPSRLKKEIAKRRALEDQMNQERAERIRAQTELDMYNRAFQQLQASQQPQHQQPGIDPLDPEAHQYYSQHYAPKNELEAIKAELQQTKMEQYRTAMAQTLHHQQAEFERTTPDWQAAYQHLYKTEVDRIKYVTGDEQYANRSATANMQQMAIMAAQQGKNVAEVFYNVAKSYGYNPKTRRPAESNLDAIETNMRKSRVADVPVASVTPGNGVSNYTTREGFDKIYSGNPTKRVKEVEDFHKILDRIKRGG